MPDADTDTGLLPRLIPALFLSLILTACSNTSGRHTYIPPTPDSNKAVIHIYRPGASAGVMANAMYSPEVQVDAQTPRRIKSGEMISLQLPAGTRKVRLLGEFVRAGGERLELTTGAGQHYFLRINSVLAIPQASEYHAWQREFSLSQIDAEQAHAEIGACCHREVRRQQEKENNASGDPRIGAAEPGTNRPPGDNQAADNQAADRQGKSGFSIEKTANPFSHSD